MGSSSFTIMPACFLPRSQLARASQNKLFSPLMRTWLSHSLQVPPGLTTRTCLYRKKRISDTSAVRLTIDAGARTCFCLSQDSWGVYFFLPFLPWCFPSVFRPCRTLAEAEVSFAGPSYLTVGRGVTVQGVVSLMYSPHGTSPDCFASSKLALMSAASAVLSRERLELHTRHSWSTLSRTLKRTFVGHLRHSYIIPFIFIFDWYLFSGFPCSSYVPGAQQIRLYHSPILVIFVFLRVCIRPV
ncbi:Piso0_002664 [Millerozyma farinosa CBS 7064]|uniref:Piso0_002664 protein n=1 Tax=Pichia sorbitophila (strain ATCC MYA-4447 / BCRC 22081 / CBS 7064 / NBRC 10061 / NRRL Y-12695) TaxID=559304 RepID=G8YFM7_PICSO|nr:Piso0_002664 [Millerozyma farinosa CBS 7064]